MAFRELVVLQIVLIGVVFGYIVEDDGHVVRGEVDEATREVALKGI